MAGKEKEPFEISLWRDYKMAIEQGQDAKIFLQKVSHQLNAKGVTPCGVGHLSQLIWDVEQSMGTYWCKVNNISSDEWAEMEQYG